MIRYIYLAAVKGLSALGDIFPAKIIPILIRNFLDAKVNELVRLKIAESMLDVARRCGQTLPKYADVVVDGFLKGLRDPLSSIRISSLSLLAQMCKQLGYAFSPFSKEIIDAVVAIVNSEKKDQEIRRGKL